MNDKRLQEVNPNTSNPDDDGYAQGETFYPNVKANNHGSTVTNDIAQVHDGLQRIPTVPVHEIVSSQNIAIPGQYISYASQRRPYYVMDHIPTALPFAAPYGGYLFQNVGAQMPYIQPTNSIDTIIRQQMIATPVFLPPRSPHVPQILKHPAIRFSPVQHSSYGTANAGIPVSDVHTTTFQTSVPNAPGDTLCASVNSTKTTDLSKCPVASSTTKYESLSKDVFKPKPKPRMSKRKSDSGLCSTSNSKPDAASNLTQSVATIQESVTSSTSPFLESHQQQHVRHMPSETTFHEYNSFGNRENYAQHPGHVDNFYMQYMMPEVRYVADSGFEHLGYVGEYPVSESRKVEPTRTSVRTITDVNSDKYASQAEEKLHDEEDVKTEAIDDDNEDTDFQSDDEDTQTKCFVKIKGICRIKSRDNIEYYFENKRRSGGGKILDVNYDKNDDDVCYIKYESPTDAERVASKSHTVECCELDVTPFTPPKKAPFCKNKVLIQGLASTTSQESLFNFIEAKTGCEPLNMLRGQEDIGSAIVTMRQELDFASVQKGCSKHSLEGAKLNIDKVRFSNCILVSKLPTGCSRDTLLYYFENHKRSGGGDVTDVVFNNQRTACLVVFKNYKSVESVTVRPHVLNKQNLIVKEYYECLGKPRGWKKETHEEQQEHVTVSVDVNVLRYLRLETSSSKRSEIDRRLKQINAITDWSIDENDNITLVSTLETHSKKESWCETSSSMFQECIKDIAHVKCDVPENIFECVSKAMKSVNFEKPESVLVKIISQEKTITITGEQNAVEALRLKLNEIINTQKDFTVETFEVKPLVCRLLQKAAIITAAANECNVKHSVNTITGSITIEGKSADVKQFKLIVYERKDSTHVERLNLNKSCLELLAMEGPNDFLTRKLFESNILFELELFKDYLQVTCLSAPDVQKALEVIKNIICESKLSVCRETLPYLDTEDWHSQVEDIQKKYDYKLLIDTYEQCVSVTATADIIEECIDKIKSILSTNARVQVKYSCPEAKFLFAQRYLQQNLEDICKRLEKDGVQILFCSKHEGFIIRGTQEGITHVQSNLDTIIKSIKCQDYEVREPHFVKCISSKDGQTYLRTIEKDVRCVIMKDKNTNLCDANNIEEKLVQRITKHNTVYVFLGDITNLSAEVLVNSSDEKLSLAYGLGKTLKQKGGKRITEDCADYIATHGELNVGEICMTTAGDLRSRKIMHVHIPTYAREHGPKKMKKAILSCLEEANDMGSKSIALPGLGCGALKYPEDLAADTIVNAVVHFSNENKVNSIEKIFICDMKASVVDCIVSGFRRQNDERGFGRNTSARKVQSSKFKPVNIGNVSVSVVQGSIAKLKADAIVNVTDQSLNLSYGKLSTSLAKVAGVNLQQELTSKYPNGLQVGQVAVTSGHKLMCSTVLHACLEKWNGNNLGGIKVFTLNCLHQANMMNYTSVIFPSIGTGRHGYPKDEAAKEMFLAVETFAMKNTMSSIQEVLLVIYHDDMQTLQTFENEKQLWSTGKRQVSLQKRPLFAENYGDGAVQIGELSVKVKKGDLTEEDADGIVVSIPLTMDFQRGALSKSLLMKCGEEIVDELAEKKQTFRNYNLVTSAAPNLRCKRIFYLAHQSESEGWKKVIIKALKDADKKRMKSLAFPAIGTGRGTSPNVMAKVMLQAIRSFERTSTESLKEIRIVIFQNEMLEVFRTVANGLTDDREGDTSSDDEDQEHNRTVNHGHSSNVSTAVFTIAAQETSIIQRAINKIDKCLDKKEFKEETIKKFNQYHEKQLSILERNEHVKIELNRDKGRILMWGFSENVQKASDEINRILRDALKLEKSKSNAELMSNIVQWYYEKHIGTDARLVAFDKKTNLEIENAYTAKKPSITIRTRERVAYVVDFKRMVDYPVDKPNESVKVKRKDLKEEAVRIPSHWKDLDGNLNLVSLANTDNEYMQVANAFKTSIQGAVTVLKIERVQNKALWLQYQAYKQQMEQKNPPNIQNERILWHGSSPIGIENIKVHGFDRSYSNSSNCGVGVYFSPYASVSRGFARQDGTGTCRMFRCRVLTGEYTLAQSGIRTGPPKPAGGPNAKYDSVVNNMTNPTEIVIFNDTQAYPEYLISFR